MIADADTGFGNALSVMRTTREIIQAGAAAMLLEDQLAPKRCGHMVGKWSFRSQRLWRRSFSSRRGRTEVYAEPGAEPGLQSGDLNGCAARSIRGLSGVSRLTQPAPTGSVKG